MFLPMSWTSPFTVAISTLPAACRVPPAGLLGLHERLEVGDRALHRPRALDHLRQEHLARRRSRSPTIFMPSISGPSMTSSGRPSAWRASSASCSMKSTTPCTSACASRSPTVPCAPGQVGLALRARALDLLGEGHQALGGVGPAVEDDVLDVLEQVGRDVLVDRELAGVDDAHVEAGLDGVVEERRVDRLAHHLVAAERERQVADAAADSHAGAGRLDLPRRLDEVHGVVVVLLEAGGDGQHVGVEDDVERVDAGLLGEQLVGALADRDLASDGVGLALLVEGHHHHRRAVAADGPGLVQEVGFALLQADRVDDALALHALEAGLDHRPLASCRS